MRWENIPSGPSPTIFKCTSCILLNTPIMPIVDPRKKINVPFNVIPTFNMGSTFDPGNAPGPWSGYASQINTESELKIKYMHFKIVISLYTFLIVQVIYIIIDLSHLVMYNNHFLIYLPNHDLNNVARRLLICHSNVFYSSTRVDTMNTFDEQSQQQQKNLSNHHNKNNYNISCNFPLTLHKIST